MKKSIIALSLLAITSTCHADLFVSVEKGVFTDHIVEKDYGEWHEDNNLLGFEIGYGDFSLQYAQFDNSFDVPSKSLGLNYEVFDFHGLVFGVGVGAVKGYDADQLPLSVGDYGIYIAPSIGYNVDIADNVTVSPVVRLFGEAIVGTVKLSYKF